MKITQTYDIPFKTAIEYCEETNQLCRCCDYEMDCARKVTADSCGLPVFPPCSSNKIEDLYEFIDEETACNIYFNDNYG